MTINLLALPEEYDSFEVSPLIRVFYFEGQQWSEIDKWREGGWFRWESCTWEVIQIEEGANEYVAVAARNRNGLER